MRDQSPYNSRWRKFIQISITAYLAVIFLVMSAVLVGLFLGFRYFNQRLNNLSQQVNPQVPRVYVEVTVPNDASALGQADAPVALIEFADFQCPFCKDFYDKIFPEIKTRYIDTGKARFVFQNFAFLGEESLSAAAAAKCAKDQDKFWPYHDLLYARQQGENNGTFNILALKSFAAELQLNQVEFNQCLDSGKHKEAVLAETKAGEGFGVQATPTLFINGVKYEGVATVPEYVQAIDQALAEPKK